MRRHVGQILEIARYPVKSMGGAIVPEGELDWQGMEGDRQFAFYRKEDRSRFPWLSGRNLPDLVRYTAAYRDPAAPRRSAVEVATPAGERLELHDPALLARLSEAAGCDLGLLQSGRGTYDSMPVSVTTTAAHAALDAAHGAVLDRRRFRANIVVKTDEAPSDWLAGRLAFGDGPDHAEVLITNPIPRCSLITIDPDTGERDPSIIRTVAQAFANMFGVYSTTSRTGVLRVGDPVYLSA